MLGKTNTGGGGLRLTVVGGTVQPEHAVNGPIWVNTSDAINKYYVQRKTPDSPNEGDLRIQYGQAGETDINISRTNFFRLKVLAVKQYLSGSWADKTFKTYYDNAWSE